MINRLGTQPHEMRKRDEEIGERDTHMETAQDGGRETDRAKEHAIDEGHTETEEAIGSETVIVLEVVQEGEAENGKEEDANTQRLRKRQRNVDNEKKNKPKRLRNSGQSYMNSHDIQVPRRRMREKHFASCCYKCNENFPEEVREKYLNILGRWEMQRGRKTLLSIMLSKERK